MGKVRKESCGGEGPQGLFVVKARSCELRADRPSNMQTRMPPAQPVCRAGVLYIIDIWHGRHGSWNEQGVSGPAPDPSTALSERLPLPWGWFPGAGGKGLHSPPNGSAAILEPVDANAAVGLLSDATSKLAPTPPPAKPENIAISAGEDNLRNATRARPPSGRRQPRR